MKSRLNLQFNFFWKTAVRIRMVFPILGIAVFLLPLVDPAEQFAPGLVYFIGRFHPLVIHFPVVLVFLALMFEIFRSYFKWDISSRTIGVILVLGLTGSIISLSMGFMLYYTGEYTGDIMAQHLWGWITFTYATIVSFYLFLSWYKSRSITDYRYYISILLVTNALLIYTSHQGGSLTHGREYLTEYMPRYLSNEEELQPKPLDELLVYDDVIVSFLDKKCMSCHNENKAKGDLIMTSYQGLLNGGKGDATLIPGSSQKSALYHRVTLPPDEKKHMPPDGKTPLTAEEIKLLSYWIDKGANPELTVQEAVLDMEIQPVIQDFLVELKNRELNRLKQKQSAEKLIQSVSQRSNFLLQIDPQDESGLALSMTFPSTVFEDNDLLNVQPVFSNITKASFIGSNITDDSFYHIGQMTALRELYLQQTKINGNGLIYLSKLSNLKLLDLSKTEISNGHLLHVLKFSSLQDLYLNETSISEEIIEAIRSNQPGLNLHLARGSLF